MHRLSFVLILAVLVGCSGRPSGPAIERLLQAQIDKEIGGGSMAVENFKKVNGYQKSESVYVAQVEYDLVYLKSTDEIVGGLAGRAKAEAETPLGGVLAGLGSVAVRMALGQHKAGDTIHREHEIELLNTEKGWRLGTP